MYLSVLSEKPRKAERTTGGFFGSAPIACGGGAVSDLFSEKDRASAMAVYSLGPLIGPAVGPIAGGFIAETIGFKYIFIVISAVSGVAAAFGIPFLRETYAPVIRLRIAKHAVDPEKAAQMHPHLVQNHGGKLHLMWINLTRPFILLTRSLVCFVLSLYMALCVTLFSDVDELSPTLWPVACMVRTRFSPTHRVQRLTKSNLGIYYLMFTTFPGT